jgi:hypothetical protein
VLDFMVGSLRPGGWDLIEDFDNMFLDAGSAATPEQATVRKVALAFKRLLQGRGADLAYARRLPDLLRAHGLRGVAGEGRIVFGFGGSPAAQLAAANYSQVGEEMVQEDLCTRDELRSTLDLLAEQRGRSTAPSRCTIPGRHSIRLGALLPALLLIRVAAQPAPLARSLPRRATGGPRCGPPNKPARSERRSPSRKEGLLSTDSISIVLAQGLVVRGASSL